MSNQDQYSGQEYREGAKPKNAPEAPRKFQASESGGRGVGKYATVQFKGRYGLGCTQYQEFERSNLTRKQAQEIAWDYFGACGKTITYLDEDGNVVLEE